MQYHLSDIQFLLCGFALVLIIIFAVAAFLDDRWRNGPRLRTFHLEPDSNLMAHDHRVDSKDSANESQTSYAESDDLELDTAEGRVTFDSELQRLEGD